MPPKAKKSAAKKPKIAADPNPSGGEVIETPAPVSADKTQSRLESAIRAQLSPLEARITALEGVGVGVQRHLNSISDAITHQEPASDESRTYFSKGPKVK